VSCESERERARARDIESLSPNLALPNPGIANWVVGALAQPPLKYVHWPNRLESTCTDETSGGRRIIRAFNLKPGARTNQSPAGWPQGKGRWLCEIQTPPRSTCAFSSLNPGWLHCSAQSPPSPLIFRVGDLNCGECQAEVAIAGFKISFHFVPSILYHSNPFVYQAAPVFLLFCRV
jgi:hypothetical protein